MLLTLLNIVSPHPIPRWEREWDWNAQDFMLPVIIQRGQDETIPEENSDTKQSCTWIV